jgi:type III pantothenate kinase
MANDVSDRWLALVIGNSRLHWGLFSDSTLEQTWDTAHVEPEAIALPLDLTQHDLWMASVVPAQTQIWQACPHAHVIQLNHIPIANLYSTLGIDRALALWGAIQQWNAPALVIDAGTAMTFTGANAVAELLGGAILPGLQLQLRSLSQHTAALPSVELEKSGRLPDRWSCNTPDAILSGVLYTALASLQSFVEAWLQEHPNSAIALTGGDSLLLYKSLTVLNPALAAQITHDPHLIFRGIPAIRTARLRSP